MDLSKKLLTLLAIFCVIASAGVVCAADVSSNGLDDNQYSIPQEGYAGSQYDENQEGGYAGSQYDVNQEGGYAGSQYDVNQEGGYAGSQYDVNQEGGYAGSQYNKTVENAAGEHLTETGNITGNTTGNATASHTMPATGNPIMALFAVCAILGGYAIIRRK